MRDHLVLYINGARQVVTGRDAFLSLSDYVRRRLGLIGTKIVCSEGDCGACTTLIGRPNAERTEFAYRPVDACIQFMFQLDGTHVVTVEGLRRNGSLNRVQQAMIDCHGSQCGFCTPGFVMSMTGLLEQADALDEPNLRHGLTGNLCRCTGYTPIIDAGLHCDGAEHDRLSNLYPAAPILADFNKGATDAIEIAGSTGDAAQRVACPTTLDDALAFLAANPTARLVAGATDVGVRANKSGRLPDTILDLNRIAELDFVEVTDAELRCGARATWTSILDAVSDPPPSKGREQPSTVASGDRAQGGSPSAVRGGTPDRRLNGKHESTPTPLTHPLSSGERGRSEFARILSIFGAPQIRHVGTIGGNIANASPIADSLPLLFVMDATLTLASAGGRREVNINKFYRGYKQLDLNPGELIAEIRVPLPADDDLLRLYKVSRRRDLDISTFTAAIRLRLSGDEITDARIAYGGVGPVVLRAPRTEEFLAGQPFTLETMQAAGAIAVEEITPITDVRGAADYRRQLARNVLLKFYHQHQGELTTAQ